MNDTIALYIICYSNIYCTCSNSSVIRARWNYDLRWKIHQEGLDEEDIRKYVENQKRQQATLQQCVSIYKGIKADGLNPRAETLFILPGILQTLRPVIDERTGNTVYFSYENRNGQRSSINLTNSLTGIAKAMGALYMGMLNKEFRGYRDDIIKAIYLEPSAVHIVDSFPRSFVHASFFQLCIDNRNVTKPE